MRTLIIIVGGLVLLGLFMLVGRQIGGDSAALVRAAACFVPVWFVLAAFNMWIGVSKAGYSLAEEAPIFAVIFVVPTLVAAFLWWKLSRT